MPTITIYLKDNCPLCDEALSILNLLRSDYSFEVEKWDIETNDDWLERYQLQIPVVIINGAAFNGSQISYEALERALSAFEAK
ncbi:hypothetical protein GCM10028778_05650 [Barrientosiimonas marina]|uniref:Glutaredoxin family protein n=1 Tax=Lentibacillus kimchii TaxID=1542911 RepID=A0ABW2US38_9BACI